MFYLNLLLVLPALAVGWRWLPRDHATAGKRQFDLLGAIMLPTILSATAGLLMLTTRGSTASVLGVGIPVVIVLAAAALATVVGFGLQARPEAHAVGWSETAGGTALGDSVADHR